MKQMTSETNTNQENRSDNPDNMSGIKKIGVVALIAVASLGYLEIVRETTNPHFSKDTKNYIVKPYEGIGDAAMHVKGASKMDLRTVEGYIKKLPANNEVFSDGPLKPGQRVVIPDSVER